ncbi:P-loop containing nucleoside triphosphate hydrolase protein [Suillus subalutaceus]|uniref:P-loop containing nucleoside triphosphate hydrolase protein n=1 Tax=Suillus subalutaceus TaxID=48586 RepID=UPI001B86F4C3|nr:P-loop containing nucleoside triphosphate hydrolase protein [Suillus subalutaceus]KAG1849293.1 P-loop containing nucleoside triphosphate hydrolase protein [Suillus subalutaceus]
MLNFPWARRVMPPTDTQKKRTPFLERRLGVWRVLIAADGSSSFRLPNLQWGIISTHIPLLTRGYKDIHSISPMLFWLMVVTHLWYAIEDPLSLYFSNRLLLLIQRSLLQGKVHTSLDRDLCIAIIARASCSLFSGFVQWTSNNVKDQYCMLVNYRLQERLLRANLARDLETSQDNEARLTADPEQVFRCLVRLLDLGKEIISFLLQLQLLLHLLGSEFASAGPVSIVLCFLPLMLENMWDSDLWSKAYVKQAVNGDYLRKEALTLLTDHGYKAEVMGGNLLGYLLKEYQKVHDALSHIPNGDVETLWSRSTTALPNMVLNLCNDGPVLYIGLLALMNPSQVSVVQLAMLEQTATRLRYTFAFARHIITLWPSELASVKNFYRLLDLKNKMKDGCMPYSPAAGALGVSLEVRNVSFNYPGAKSERDALKNVSFSIKAGQLVVIVGANGSGKSTILKLLTRCYDPTSGTVLVDGNPIEDYQIADLRSVTASLTQEHTIFPLSLSENIGIGSPSSATDLDKITQAAKLAGAQDVIENFTSGYDTVLEPGGGNEALEKEYEKMEKTTNVSGGEKQRLVASRTFMRMLSEDIKFVIVDEPSSALDPGGEFELFKQLREARKGRTMIFVTHRFGHLTKFADLILCMKGGTVVETGTHQELLSHQGEYAHLYNVQAQAFT